jgi:hypothetical protein
VQDYIKDAFPSSRRSSAVTLTLSEGAKLLYAEVLATTREKNLLAEVGIQLVRIRKAITGAIILEIPGDNAAPTRTAKLRVVGIDISVIKRELWDTLALTGDVVLRRFK